MWCYVGIEIICAATRLPFLKVTAGLDVWHFVRNVILRSIFPICAITLSCYATTRLEGLPFRFILTLNVSAIVGAATIWLTALQPNEKNILRNILLSKLKKK